MHGGGIALLSGGHLTLERSSISFNTVRTRKGHSTNSAFGGGFFSLGTSTIRDSAVIGNLAASRGKYSTTFGGGIFNGYDMTIVNSTIAKNAGEASSYAGGFGNGHTSKVYGGGIYQYAGVLTIRHSTIADNRCNDRTAPDKQKGFGGGIYISAGSLAMHHSVVAKNFTQSGHCPDFWGALSDSSYNLFAKSTCGTGYSPTDILNVNSLLGDLQDNGGPTLTMALLPGSAAIDAGDPNPENPPEWDQRGPGFPRIVNGRIDIGAFEVQATGAALPTHDPATLITADLKRTILGGVHSWHVAPSGFDDGMDSR
jgi:hypothetical protein